MEMLEKTMILSKATTWEYLYQDELTSETKSLSALRRLRCFLRHEQFQLVTMEFPALFFHPVCGLVELAALLPDFRVRHE